MRPPSPAPEKPVLPWVILLIAVLGGIYWAASLRLNAPAPEKALDGAALRQADGSKTIAVKPLQKSNTRIQRGAAPDSPATSKSAPPRPSAPELPVALPAAAQKPTDNIVNFRIIDGLAVAYGDIILGKPNESVPGGRGRAEAPTPAGWGRPEIPYVISPQLPNPERVEKALTYLREKTPVNFVPFDGQRDAIVFEPGTEHCLSALGKVGGLQPIKLSKDCGPREVLHEILHSLGFIHEQSRPDRDRFVEILWENIDEKYHDQFAMVPETMAEPVRDTHFDFRSTMLYPSGMFAKKPGMPTMKPIDEREAILPVGQGLSDQDIRRLNRMFRGYE